MSRRALLTRVAFSAATFAGAWLLGEAAVTVLFAADLESWEAPGGGRGYQRVPSLISIWSTAPYLHNNEVGKFTNDPSLDGRMEAYDDAIRLLLWPERRGTKVHRVEHAYDIYYGGEKYSYEVDEVGLRVRTSALPDKRFPALTPRPGGL